MESCLKIRQEQSIREECCYSFSPISRKLGMLCELTSSLIGATYRKLLHVDSFLKCVAVYG
jgi:hypothetical protein